MKLLLTTLTIIAVLGSHRLAGDEPDRAVDFRNDLIPVLTKHGCNAGACHGAAIPNPILTRSFDT